MKTLNSRGFQSVSTSAIVNDLAQKYPDAPLDVWVRGFAQNKLDAWQGRHVANPEARLHGKATKLAAAVRAVRPNAVLNTEAMHAQLQQAVQELVPPPLVDLPPLKLMDLCLGDAPHWRALQVARAAQLRDAGVPVFSANEVGASEEAIATAYRAWVVAELTPKGVGDAAVEVNNAQGSLDDSFTALMAVGERAWQQVDRSVPVDVPRLAEILKVGRANTLNPAARQAIANSGTAAVNLLEAYKARKQFVTAQNLSASMQLADSFWFFFGRDPFNSDAAQLDVMQKRMLGVTAALSAVPGMDGIMPPVSMLRLEEKVLDVAKGENIDRWTWVQEKLRAVLSLLPLRVVEQGGFGKMCWTMMGLAVGRAAWLPAELSGDALDAEMFRGLQEGLYFGMSYPFIDDMLDDPTAARALGGDAQATAAQLEEMLWSGRLNRESLPKVPAVDLLHEAFSGLQELLGADAPRAFRELALMLRAQRTDAALMRQPQAEGQESPGYVSALIKNTQTSRATTVLFGAPDAEGNDLALWGMLGQVLDDFIDAHEDAASGNETTFTHALREFRPEDNPLEAMLQLILHLDAGHAAESSARTFLGRRLVRALRRIGSFDHGAVLRSMLDTLAPNVIDPVRKLLLEVGMDRTELLDVDRQVVNKLRAASGSWSKSGRSLLTYMHEHKSQVDALMAQPLGNAPSTWPLGAGKQYVMGAGGKRLRPLLVMMTADVLGLERGHVGPLCRAVEQLHTTSLIFDDLPAQDNAPLRRGRDTLHTTAGSWNATQIVAAAKPDASVHDYVVLNPQAEARAQLTGLSLIGEAVEGVGGLAQYFDAAHTVAVIRYMGEVVQRLSDGQMMDLLTPSREAPVDVAYLERMAELKTGQAFDLCVRPVGILAGRSAEDLQLMTDFANRLGVLYQVKDDLLDVEGDASATGKEIGVDERNGNKTFVTVLGVDEARAHLSRVNVQVTAILNTMEQRDMRVSLLRDLQALVVARKS